MSKVTCMFCFKTSTPEGRRGEKGGSADFKIKHKEPLTQEVDHTGQIRFGPNRFAADMMEMGNLIEKYLPSI